MAGAISNRDANPDRELTGAFSYFDAKATLDDFRGRTMTATGHLLGADDLAMDPIILVGIEAIFDLPATVGMPSRR